MGEIAEVENPIIDGRLIRSFMRALVEVNIQTPLSTGCWVPRKDRPRIWVGFKYEKLHDLCFKCGVLGHEQKDCKKERVMSPEGRNGSKYGPRVGVPPARPISEILADQERWKTGMNSTPGGGTEEDEQESSKDNEIFSHPP